MVEHAAVPDLDLIVIGSVLVELTPEQGGRSLTEANRFVSLPAGSAANFALALAALGVSVGVMSRVGDDELGNWLIAQLAGRGVTTGLMKRVPGQLTPVSFCWANQAGDKTFYFYRFPQFSDPMGSFLVDEVAPVQVLRAKVFDFTEAAIRAQPPRDAALYGAAIARQAGRTVCYAVNYRPGSWDGSLDQVKSAQRQAMSAADIVLMNEEEAQFIFETESLDEASARASELGPSVVVITRGAGDIRVGHRGEQTTIDSYPVTVQYDVGAGDAFHAGFIAGYLRGMSAPQAARLGAAVAALKISQPASAPPPTWEEVQEFMRQW